MYTVGTCKARGFRDGRLFIGSDRMRTATSQELWEVRYVHSGTDGAEWAEPLKGIGGICHPPPLDCAAACKLARMDAGIRSNIDRPDTGTKASRWSAWKRRRSCPDQKR